MSQLPTERELLANICQDIPSRTLSRPTVPGRQTIVRAEHPSQTRSRLCTSVSHRPLLKSAGGKHRSHQAWAVQAVRARLVVLHRRPAISWSSSVPVVASALTLKLTISGDATSHAYKKWRVCDTLRTLTAADCLHLEETITFLSVVIDVFLTYSRSLKPR